jgi:RHS repeat-associated protein
MQLNYQSGNVYFAGRLIRAEGNPVTTDRLGSVRNGGPGPLGYQAQYPYGVEYTLTVNDREKYATYTRDNAGLDYAANRYYSSQWGRFLSPDPYGGSAATGNPQSWNRYAYVGGDPANSSDPSGLAILAPDGPDGPDDPGSGPIWGFNGPSSSGGGWLFGGGCNGLPNPGNWYDAGLSSPWFGPWFAGTAACEQGFLPTVGVGAPGGGGGSLQAVFLAPAVRGAEALLGNNPPCDQLFNTGSSSDPATVLQDAYANNQIRLLPFGDNVPAGVGAQTTGINGIIQIASNRYFVTGILANGTPITQATSPNFQGLSLSQIDEVILIHELLHFTGSVGADNAGQSITLANGVTVTGSVGVTNEVRKDCLHQ